MPKNVTFDKEINFDHSLLFIFSSPTKIELKSNYNSISLPWPVSFSTRAPLLPLPPHNPLDHVSGQYRPLNIAFEDLELHGHSYTFPLE